METTINSLFSLQQPQEGEENFATLLQNSRIKIVGIRSKHKKMGEVYNQNADEWVLLVQGQACLKVQEAHYELKSGDYLFISKHTPHQIISTDDDTLWLGIFIS